MDKKEYKVEIPADLLRFLNDPIISLNGEIVIIVSDNVPEDNTTFISPVSKNHDLFNTYIRIKTAWLREIKEPDNAYDLAVSCLNNYGDYREPTALEIALVTEGEKLERKKHEPKKTFNEWFFNFKEEFSRLNAELIWKCCEKNRGYDE